MLTVVSADAPPVTGTEPAAEPFRVDRELLAIVAITAIGAILRFATLGSQSYWVDEATTVHEMHVSFGALLHQVRVNETTPPLYFVLAWLWAKIFGTGEVGLRSLSALLGTAVIPITYLCGRELISRWAGLVAAAFAAVSPFLIWYSQEARSYMLFATLCGLSLLFFARARRVPSTRNIGLWALFSALAVTSHFFAGFLVAPEGVWLLISIRTRAVLIADAVVAGVQVAVIPLAVSDTHHPLSWIQTFPLSVRIQQIPVDFGLSTLFQSPVVTEGLLGAAVLAAVVAGFLLAGSTREQRRGAAVVAILAACVILLPIALAEFGRDYVVARNFMPAWIPLAILLGAACTASRTLPVGAALAALALGAFVWAGVRIDQDPQYQRPNWRGVAAALGSASGPRAIVAYASGFASQPLEVYLRGIPWGPAGPEPVTVGEVDLIGNTYQTLPHPLPAGITLLGSRTVDGFLVDRFRVAPAWRLPPSTIGQRATMLFGPGAPTVLIQQPT
jgi:4-amino-4-deoxy-L-arabinose transferase-like glycosyltransferase